MKSNKKKNTKPTIHIFNQNRQLYFCAYAHEVFAETEAKKKKRMYNRD